MKVMVEGEMRRAGAARVVDPRGRFALVGPGKA